MSLDAEKKMATSVAKIALIATSLLAFIKLLLGIIANSGALISDAVHSFSDLGATSVVLVSFRFSKKAPDDNHPYGHEKIESLVGIALAFILLGTAAGIAMSGWHGIQAAMRGEPLVTPGAWALFGAFLSIATQETLYRFTIVRAKQLGSSALEANAWHHRSDAFSSIGSFVGIAGARLGWPVLDPVAAIIISLFIVKVAIEIIVSNISQTIDVAIDEATEQEMRQMVLQLSGVRAINEMRTRQSASKMFVDLSIACDAALNLEEAHLIAENVHDMLEANYSRLLHCNVHVEPYYEEVPAR